MEESHPRQGRMGKASEEGHGPSGAVEPMMMMMMMMMMMVVVVVVVVVMMNCVADKLSREFSYCTMISCS